MGDSTTKNSFDFLQQPKNSYICHIIPWKNLEILLHDLDNLSSLLVTHRHYSKDECLGIIFPHVFSWMRELTNLQNNKDSAFSTYTKKNMEEGIELFNNISLSTKSNSFINYIKLLFKFLPTLHEMFFTPHSIIIAENAPLQFIQTMFNDITQESLWMQAPIYFTLRKNTPSIKNSSWPLYKEVFYYPDFKAVEDDTLITDISFYNQPLQKFLLLDLSNTPKPSNNKLAFIHSKTIGTSCLSYIPVAPAINDLLFPDDDNVLVSLYPRKNTHHTSLKIITDDEELCQPLKPKPTIYLSSLYTFILLALGINFRTNTLIGTTNHPTPNDNLKSVYHEINQLWSKTFDAKIFHPDNLFQYQLAQLFSQHEELKYKAKQVVDFYFSGMKYYEAIVQKSRLASKQYLPNEDLMLAYYFSADLYFLWAAAIGDPALSAILQLGELPIIKHIPPIIANFIPFFPTSKKLIGYAKKPLAKSMILPNTKQSFLEVWQEIRSQLFISTSNLSFVSFPGHGHVISFRADLIETQNNHYKKTCYDPTLLKDLGLVIIESLYSKKLKPWYKKQKLQPQPRTLLWSLATKKNLCILASIAATATTAIFITKQRNNNPVI